MRTQQRTKHAWPLRAGSPGEGGDTQHLCPGVPDGSEELGEKPARTEGGTCRRRKAFQCAAAASCLGGAGRLRALDSS